MARFKIDNDQNVK